MRRREESKRIAISIVNKETAVMNLARPTVLRPHRGIVAILAAVTALVAMALAAAPAQALDCETESNPQCFALEKAEVSLSSAQAGAHADQTTFFQLSRDPNAFLPEPQGNTENVTIELPPGIAGNPTAVPNCDPQQFTTPAGGTIFGSCPNATQVGLTRLRLNGLPNVVTEPVYNMRPPGGGVTARLGFIALFYPVYIDLTVRPGDHGITASIKGAPSQARLVSAKTTLWGVPSSPVHDTERRTALEAIQGGAEKSPPRPPASPKGPS